MCKNTPEIEILKSRLKNTWNTGDYGILAQDLEPSAEEFFSRIPFEPGTKLLDIACGTGQIAFPAYKSGAQVTGIDISSKSIDQAKEKAKHLKVPIQFDIGDVESMPYENNSFDLVVTLIGAMFAPRPEIVVSEMKRVCRAGGRIVMGNWTPEGYIGYMFKIMGKYVPPPPQMPSPLLWGNESIVRERLEDDISELKLTKRMYPFRYDKEPKVIVDTFCDNFGPTMVALSKLDDDGKAALKNDMLNLWDDWNQATDGSTYVDAEILEVVATLS